MKSLWNVVSRLWRATPLRLLIFLNGFMSCVPVAAQESIHVLPAKAHIASSHAGVQLLVTARAGDRTWDLTRNVTFKAEPADIVTIAEDGYITGLKDGSARIVVTSANGKSTQTEITVEGIALPPLLSFRQQVVPIFSKYGCNGGGCHGKVEGQNGFRLSLFGFVPEDDYTYLIHDARGRRLAPAAPLHSLLIRKATGALPHGGGARIKDDSVDVKILTDWMRQGMPEKPADEMDVVRIEVSPRESLLKPGLKQQLRVEAVFANDRRRDITRLAVFKANDKEMTEVTPEGLVTARDITGSSAVMIQFQEKVDVFQAMIPLGAEVTTLPKPRNLIDEHIFETLRQLGLPPSENCTDVEFLRRVTIDVAGRLPTLEETRAFRADAASDKRDRLIDRLIDSEDYADTFANKWNALLRNKRKNDSYIHGTFLFHDWVKTRLQNNLPYDQFARQILTATGDMNVNPPVLWYRAVADQKARLQDAAQIFLGVRLQCAECHHHPYEKWSQHDYYGFAAFFSRVGKKKGAPGEELVYHQPGTASARHPRTGEQVKPTPLDGEPLSLGPEDDPRKHLADWMGQADNPFFARMLVNRYWKHFFGRGLVEPEDDLRVTNPATHPKLLTALSDAFVNSGYDLKQLVRTLCQSKTYQLSALPNAHNARDRQNYSRFFPRRLNAEVLLDGIDYVTGKPTKFSGLPQGFRAVQLPDDSFNRSHYFLQVFGRPDMDSACECERSNDANLAQSLHLLNSKSIQDKIQDGKGNASRLVKDNKRTLSERLEELYLIALARPPTSEELSIAETYLNERPGEQQQPAWEDVVWALVNTKEFLFNH